MGPFCLFTGDGSAIFPEKGTEDAKLYYQVEVPMSLEVEYYDNRRDKLWIMS